MTECNAEGQQQSAETTESAPDQVMEKYIGVKIIHARPCTADEAEKILGRKVCRDNADAEGNGYLVQYKDGYLSWSPALAFEEAYELIAEDRMLKWFAFDHLPKHLQAASRPFHATAKYIVDNTEPGQERTVALRKLLESKDAAVRAVVHPGC